MIDKNRLVPPSLLVGAEVDFGPGREDNLSRRFLNITVGKSKWERSRSTDNGTCGCVLRSVAWAHELVASSGPWNDTSQVGAHCKCCEIHRLQLANESLRRELLTSIETVGFESLVFLDNQVRGVSLQTLGQRAVIWTLRGNVCLGEDIVTKGILGRNSTVTSS